MSDLAETKPYYTMPKPYHAKLYYTNTLPNGMGIAHTKPCQIIQFYTIPYNSVPYYVIPYLYHTTPFTVLYHTIL